MTDANSIAATYHWTCVTEDAAFAPRDGAGSLVFRERMWLLGGWNPLDKHHFPRICNSEVWSSAHGREWTLECAQAPWEGRHASGCVVHDGRMWVVGGDPNQGHYQYDVWSSADGVTWECATDRVPWGPRALHHTVAFEGAIWVMTGQTMPHFAPAEPAFYNDVWRSEDGACWERVLEHAPWEPRGWVAGSAVLNDRIWLLGGGTYDTPEQPERRYYNDVWSSADGVTWEQHTAAAPWAPREFHAVAAHDCLLWVMGGYADADRNDVWVSADGVTWEELPDTPWAPRHAQSVWVHDGGLWIAAGSHLSADVWMLGRG